MSFCMQSGKNIKTQKPLILFSPLNVVGHFRRLNIAIGKSGKLPRAFKKAQEMNYVAESLAGRRAADKKNYWLRSIENRHGTPDIKTYCWKNSGNIPDSMWEHFVEVTEYEEHATEPIVDFLNARKLHKYKDDQQLIILCRISRKTEIPSLLEIKQKFISLGVVNPVMFCGRVSEVDGKDAVYRLIQIDSDPNSAPESQDFNLQAELLNMTYEGVLVLDNTGTAARTQHYPFEDIGFIPDENGNYQL